MSADNYLLVRLREDGRFGISMRFASTYYADDADPWPFGQDGLPIPKDWLCDAPDDRYGIFDSATDAIVAAHKLDVYTEYGVSVSESVLAETEATP